MSLITFLPPNILYRGARFDLVWGSFATVAALGLVFCAVALVRFRGRWR